MAVEHESTAEIAEKGLFREFLRIAKELKLEWEEELYFEEENRVIDVDLQLHRGESQAGQVGQMIHVLDQLEAQFGWKVYIEPETLAA